jgi:hypothetical protein
MVKATGMTFFSAVVTTSFEGEEPVHAGRTDTKSRIGNVLTIKRYIIGLAP